VERRGGSAALALVERRGSMRGHDGGRVSELKKRGEAERRVAAADSLLVTSAGDNMARCEGIR
jgi:hypothetical protein